MPYIQSSMRDVSGEPSCSSFSCDLCNLQKVDDNDWAFIVHFYSGVYLLFYFIRLYFRSILYKVQKVQKTIGLFLLLLDSSVWLLFLYLCYCATAYHLQEHQVWCLHRLLSVLLYSTVMPFSFYLFFAHHRMFFSLFIVLIHFACHLCPPFFSCFCFNYLHCCHCTVTTETVAT